MSNGIDKTIQQSDSRSVQKSFNVEYFNVKFLIVKENALGHDIELNTTKLPDVPSHVSSYAAYYCECLLNMITSCERESYVLTAGPTDT